MNSKILPIFVLSILLLVSGCSQMPFSTNNGQTGPEEKNHGSGLRVSFSIDDEFIPSLRYTLNFENNGEETIEIAQEDFILTTTNRNVEGEIPIEEEDRETFMNQIFNEGKLILGPNQQRKFSGTLDIKEQYYQELTNSKLNIIFKVSYPYSTEFSTDVQILKDEYKLGTKSFEMSGPIAVDSIQGIFASKEQMQIVYGLKDRGNSDSKITIEDYEFSLGTDDLMCDPYRDEQENKIEIETPHLSQDNNYLYFLCDTDISEYSSSTTTQTAGSYSYKYSIEKQISVEFPQSRGTSFS